MKKLLIVLAVIVAGFSFSAQASQWSELGRRISLEINSGADTMEQMFKSQGLDVKFSSEFESSTNSVNLIFDFGSLDIVSVLNPEFIKSFKDSFTSNFIENFLQDPDESLSFPEFVKIMENGNGDISLIFKGNGKEKAVRISPEDLKQTGSKDFGLKF